MFLILILMMLITILYSNPRSTGKRGFKRPRMPWSLVNEWPLDEHDREVAYKEIKTIMTLSLDDADSKIFIKPNVNSIAGWRAKQVSYSFLSIFLFDINSFFCIVEQCGTQFRVDAQYFCLSIC